MLRGARDRAVNAALGSTLSAMRGRPNFTLVELPTGGHCANLDATDAWREALLAFWSRQPLRRRISSADTSPGQARITWVGWLAGC